MSLRQRGQRSSDAPHEGGGAVGGFSSGTSGGGIGGVRPGGGGFYDRNNSINSINSGNSTSSLNSNAAAASASVASASASAASRASGNFYDVNSARGSFYDQQPASGGGVGRSYSVQSAQSTHSNRSSGYGGGIPHGRSFSDSGNASADRGSGGSFYGQGGIIPPPPPPPPPASVAGTPRTPGAGPGAHRSASMSMVGSPGHSTPYNPHTPHHGGVHGAPPTSGGSFYSVSSSGGGVGAGGPSSNNNGTFYGGTPQTGSLHKRVSVGHVNVSGQAAYPQAPASGNSVGGGGGVGGYDYAGGAGPAAVSNAYGGYNNNSNNNNQNNSMNSESNNYSATNHYEKTHKKSFSSSSSATSSLVSILTTLAFLTLLTLTGTTIYYRHDYNQLQAELASARAIAEKMNKHQRPRSPRQQAIHNAHRSKEITSLKELNSKLQSQKDDLIAEFNRLTAQLQTTGQKLEQAENTKENLKHEAEVHNLALTHSQEEVEKYQAMVNGKEALEKLVLKREEALWERIDLLKEKIQMISKRDALEWFGPGPHKVEVTLEYPKYTHNQPVHLWPRVTKSFIIELAPLEFMPHTVDFFLTQVHNKLWDGIRLHHNMQHIYHFGVAGPHVSDIGDVTPSMEYVRFQDKTLDKLSFQEYNEQYPHVQWTVGFSGRPGGTEFYINKLDNTIIHGPGGQPGDIHADSDPCFGKVVEGMEIFKDINEIPVNELMVGRVAIKTMRMLFEEKNPVDERLREFNNRNRQDQKK